MGGILTHDELMEIIRQVEEDMPRLKAIKKTAARAFLQIET